MDEGIRESLVTQFRAFLEESQERKEGIPVGARAGDVADDLMHLYQALTGLKNEVRIESRQFKEALDRFRALFAVVEEQKVLLTRETERHREVWEDRAERSKGTFLLELVGLRDRLERSVMAMEAHRPSVVAAMSRSETAWRAGMVEGLRMVLRRLEQTLLGQGISMVETLGRPLDPETMRVIGVEHHADRDSDVVVAEDLKGYVWNGQVLRPAEVRINKKEGNKE
ncbi:MAG: nucleotide exchange factor GrpE [Magnetococcales bacterium]|nr:nucleotide exchange factor GrpE [Magnetococcales bacterium]